MWAWHMAPRRCLDRDVLYCFLKLHLKWLISICWIYFSFLLLSSLDLEWIIIYQISLYLFWTDSTNKMLKAVSLMKEERRRNIYHAILLYKCFKHLHWRPRGYFLFKRNKNCAKTNLQMCHDLMMKHFFLVTLWTPIMRVLKDFFFICKDKGHLWCEICLEYLSITCVT